MKIHAIYVGRRILLKTFQSKVKVKPVLKDPLVIELKGRKFIALFKYGAVVFWGIEKKEQTKFLRSLRPYIKEPSDVKLEEKIDVLFPKSANTITEDKIHLKEFTVETVAIVSLIISRSLALEHYENEVENVLLEFNPIMRSLEERGKAGLSTRELLKRAGFAMNIRHLSMAHMALLDRPDLAWEDLELDRFYDELSSDYEIDDRYDILKEKLESIFRNAEFILGFIDTKRGLWLEFAIVVLILVEILIFVYEVWFM